MESSYLAVKHLHVAAVAVSLGLFVVRGGWALWSPERLGRAWVRIVPHVVDTLLLASALWLAAQLGSLESWLLAKVAALLVYIGLGTLALKRGRTRRARAVALAAALATFAYIVSAAVTKSPLGFLAAL
ncbi:MAG: SirB2 family protein [Betaproteobacteria bacterium]|nr:SirB2 family protein [Betaproteobacteria bacterium]